MLDKANIDVQAPTMYVDPVLVGPLHLDEQRGLFSFTVSLSIYWQVCVILTRTTKVHHQLPLVQLILEYIQDFRLVIRPDLDKSTWQHVSFWASTELWLPEVRSTFCQDRPLLQSVCHAYYALHR